MVIMSQDRKALVNSDQVSAYKIADDNRIYAFSSAGVTLLGIYSVPAIAENNLYLIYSKLEAGIEAMQMPLN